MLLTANVSLINAICIILLRFCVSMHLSRTSSNWFMLNGLYTARATAS